MQSSQVDSGDRLEYLKEVVKSIGLKLDLFVNDNAVDLAEQENQHGERSPESD